MVGHEQRGAAGELDQSPKVEYGIIARGQVTLRQLHFPEELARLVLGLCPAAPDVDDSDPAADKLGDQIRVDLFHLIEIHHGVIVDIGGVDLDTYILGAAEYFGNDINQFQDESATILDRAAVGICTLVRSPVSCVSSQLSQLQ